MQIIIVNRTAHCDYRLDVAQVRCMTVADSGQIISRRETPYVKYVFNDLVVQTRQRTCNVHWTFDVSLPWKLLKASFD